MMWKVANNRSDDGDSYIYKDENCGLHATSSFIGYRFGRVFSHRDDAMICGDWVSPTVKPIKAYLAVLVMKVSTYLN